MDNYFDEKKREILWNAIQMERLRQYEKYKDNPEATREEMIEFVIEEIQESVDAEQRDIIVHKHGYISEMIQVCALALQCLEREQISDIKRAIGIPQ